MSKFPWIVSSFVLLLVAPVPTAAPPAQSAQACTGCIGTGGMASSSGGSCGGFVQISVSVESGQCRWFITDEVALFECKKIQGCQSTITRTWSGLTPGTVVEFCVEVDGEQLCLQKKNLVDGDGSGSSQRAGPELPCSDDASQQVTFQIESESCGLSAGVTARCSECEGDM
jgi:hypothetical protein